MLGLFPSIQHGCAATIFSLHYLPYSNALPEFLYSLYSTKYFEVAQPISLLSVKPLTSDFNMFTEHCSVAAVSQCKYQT